MNNMKIDKQNGNVAIDKLDSNNVNKVCGIYKISNSKYFYIGLSIDIRNRWKQHLRALKKGIHKNIFIQRVYNKYKDLDPFEFSILYIKHCNISNTIHGKQKTAGGFIWKI